MIDNASEDKSADMVAAEFPTVNLIKNDENIGFARACNQAFKRSRGEYVLLLNPDSLVRETAVLNMMRLMDNCKDIDAAGCKILNNDGNIEFSAFKFPNFLTESVLKIGKILSRKNRWINSFVSKKYNDSSEVDWVTGAFLLVRSNVYKELNGMDENYFLYFEDVDFCKRIKDNGGKVYYNSACEIIHLKDIYPEKENKNKRLDAYRKSQLYYYKKHNPVQYKLLRKAREIFK